MTVIIDVFGVEARATSGIWRTSVKEYTDLLNSLTPLDGAPTSNPHKDRWLADEAIKFLASGSIIEDTGPGYEHVKDRVY